jgi:hypothetical protein
MPADLLRRWPLLVVLALFGLAVPLWLGPQATLPPPAYFLHDQQHYLSMAQAGKPPAAAPFAWRVLPSALVRASGLPAERGFYALTLLTLALIPPATAIMLSAAGVSTGSALMLGLVAALAPPVAGYLSWDFIRPDGVSLLLVVASAWAAIRTRPALFIAALVALSLTKETWVIAAAFAMVWSRAYAPAFWKWTVAATLLALVAALLVRVALPPLQPYSLIANVGDLYWPFDARTIARRLLLATAATWTVLTPLATFAIVKRRREPRAWAVGIAIVLATAQILVAIDTQRLVAAALPFVLLACAWELDRLTPAVRVGAAGLLALAQTPWLLAYARLWTPSLRIVEVVLLVATLGAALYARRVSHGGNAPQRSLTMW